MAAFCFGVDLPESYRRSSYKISGGHHFSPRFPNGIFRAEFRNHVPFGRNGGRISALRYSNQLCHGFFRPDAEFRSLELSTYATDKAPFTWGDIIAAEIFTGTLSTKLQHESGNLWVAYQFDFGLGGRLTINDHSEAGLNLILLKFSRDNVSGNISGSGIVGRYRYKRLLAEGGLIARHDRALGVIIDLRDRIAMQGTWTLRYLMKRGKNIGVTAESLPGIFHQDTFQYTRIWSVKIFYGIYF